MTIQELREKRNNVWNAAKAFLDSHRGANGTLSAEDAETYDRMETEINDLGKEIKRLERAAEIEQQLAQPTSDPITGQPGEKNKAKTGRASDEYRQAALTALRSNFKHVSNVLTTDSGGVLIPEEWDRRIVEILDEENVMRSLATKIKTQGLHRVTFPVEQPAAAWIEEGGELTWSDPEFSQMVLDAHKLHVAVKVTEELLYDNAFDLEGYIIKQFGKALANAEEDGFLNGDAIGKPTGIRIQGENLTVATLDSDSLIDLVYGLKRPYRKNAVFIMNDATVAAIRKLKDSNGAYIWQPSYQAGEPDRVLGYKVYTSAYAPTDAISFGDFSYYYIADRGPRTFAELRELFAGNGMIGFVAKERVDGALTNFDAVRSLGITG